MGSVMAEGLKSPYELFLDMTRELPASALAYQTQEQRAGWFDTKIKTEVSQYAAREYGIKFTSWVFVSVLLLLGAKNFPEQTGWFLILLVISIVLIHSVEVSSWLNAFRL